MLLRVQAGLPQAVKFGLGGFEGRVALFAVESHRVPVQEFSKAVHFEA